MRPASQCIRREVFPPGTKKPIVRIFLWFRHRANIRTPEARGFAMGIASHGIATARAFVESEVAGSFAGFGMVLNAILTALIVPPAVRLFGFPSDKADEDERTSHHRQQKAGFAGWRRERASEGR